MKLTDQYIKGILKLAILLVLLCFFKILYSRIPIVKSEFKLNEVEQCHINNQLELHLNKKNKKKYYVNSISDYTGYQLGLTVSQIDNLLAYRKKEKKIYTSDDFIQITNINITKFEAIRKRLIFPKSKIQTKQKKTSRRSIKNKFESFDINKITALQLEKKLNLPDFIAERIINYRKYLKGYRSLNQLEDVYSILPYQLKRLKQNCFLSKKGIKKYNLNKISYYELSKIPYLNSKQSKQLIKFVKKEGGLSTFQDLRKIEGFSEVKINRLPLYLTLNE